MADAVLPAGLTAADAVKSILLLFSLAFFLSLALTPLVRDLALAEGFVDRPDGRRKTHRTAVPRLGGIAVHLAFALAFGAALTVFRDAPWLGPPVPAAFLHLLAAGTLVMLVEKRPTPAARPSRPSMRLNALLTPANHSRVMGRDSTPRFSVSPNGLETSRIW